MSGFMWLMIPLAPLFGALLLLRRRDAVTPWLAITCLPALLAAVWPMPAIPLSGLWPGAEWGAQDLIARAFLGFTALLWGCASVYAWANQKDHPRRLRFWGFWLLSLSGNLLLIIAQDGASFYVGFTLMSLAAYGLVVHLGGPGPRQAGRVYLQLAILGEMLLYAGLLLRIHETGGSLGFADWQHLPIGGLTAVLLLIGFGLKAGFWPLHVWLPLAHPAAPAAASAVLSGAMIKAGILGLWRFMPNSDPLLTDWASVLFAVGLISAFYGVALGLVQTKAKAALAYSSISQVGYLLAIVALAWLQPDSRALWATLLAFYAVHHALAKGALFLGAGITASYQLSKTQWALMALPALALAGLPFTSGGAVKALFKTHMYDTALNQWLLLLSLGAFTTMLLVGRAVWLMHKAQASLIKTPAPRALIYPWALLSAMSLLLPWLWPELRGQLLASLSLSTSWALLWPVLIAIAVSAMVVRSGWTLPVFLTRLPQPVRYASLQLYRLINRPPLPPLKPVLAASPWRNRERRWNRFWQKNTLTISAWVLLILLLLGWLG